MRKLPRMLFLSSLLAISLSSICQDKSSKPEKFDCPETKAINKDKVTDAYPYISGDGLRLYFTSNRLGGHGRFYISTRKSTSDPFGEPVILSKNLTDGCYAGTLTADELTLYMAKQGGIYVSKRKSMRDEFSVPIEVKGIKSTYHFAPSISPNGSEMIVMSDEEGNKDVIKVYKRITDTEFDEAGELPTPAGSDPGPGQLSKDGLSYYFSFETEDKKEASIWKYSRKSLNDAFVDLEELPVKINALKRNFQPTVNADASILVYTTSQNNLWEEDDLVLVNDVKAGFEAPEKFTEIKNNEAGDITVKNKVTTALTRAFPNPFQSYVVLEMNAVPENGATFILYDIGGKMIRQQKVNSAKTTIQLGNLPAATYIYHVLDADKRLISAGKLIKG
jgi:hypothetical protein